MEQGIYKIINPKGEVYIGKTKDFSLRQYKYKHKNCKSQPKLLHSILTYGWENHTFEAIDSDLTKEKYYIELYNSCIEGLNCNRGGGGVITHTEETCKLISEKGKANKGNRNGKHRLGVVESNETRLKKSLAFKGRASHRKGKTISQQHKDNIRKSIIGKPKLNNRKAVLQYDKQMNLIAEHDCIENAAKAVKGNPSAISNALKKGGKSTSSSYIWLYKK